MTKRFARLADGVQRQLICAHIAALESLPAIRRVMLVGLVFTIMASPAFADNLGDVFNRLAGQGEGVAAALKILGVLFGFGFTIAGFIMLVNAQKTQQPKSIPVLMICIGFLLVSITAVISMGSESVFGSDSSELEEIGL